MSFANPARNFRSAMGRKTHAMSHVDINADVYCRTLSEAVRSTWHSVKGCAHDLGVNVATAKNIFDAKNGANGVTLIKAMRESDEVLFAILELAGKADMVRRAQAMRNIEQAKALLDQVMPE